MATPTSRRLAGVTSCTIQGNAYDIVGDCVWSASVVKRETLMGQTRVEGYSEMPSAGFIAMMLRDSSAFSVRNFNGLTDVTVVVFQANGKQIYGDGMWNTETSEVKTQEGTFTVRFEGNDVYEGGVVG